MVLEASGKIRRRKPLIPISISWASSGWYGLSVKGEVAGEEVLNIVYGINHHLYERPAQVGDSRFLPPTAWLRW